MKAEHSNPFCRPYGTRPPPRPPVLKHWAILGRPSAGLNEAARYRCKKLRTPTGVQRVFFRRNREASCVGRGISLRQLLLRWAASGSLKKPETRHLPRKEFLNELSADQPGRSLPQPDHVLIVGVGNRGSGGGVVSQDRSWVFPLSNFRVPIGKT